MFTNVNPSTSNTVSGYFGIGGFHISCTANYDKTRVEFILDNLPISTKLIDNNNNIYYVNC